MPQRPCLTCGAYTAGTRCQPCHRQHKAKYNAPHRHARTAWLPAINAGTVTCWRCHQPINPTQPWDLGHRQGQPSHPEHPYCNRSHGPLTG